MIKERMENDDEQNLLSQTLTSSTISRNQPSHEGTKEEKEEEEEMDISQLVKQPSRLSSYLICHLFFHLVDISIENMTAGNGIYNLYKSCSHLFPHLIDQQIHDGILEERMRDER